MTTRILLLLAFTVCVIFAQRPVNQRCTCRRVRNGYKLRVSTVQDVLIYPPSPFCDKTEVIVSLKNGLQYCLDPNISKVQQLIASFVKATTHATTLPRPTEPTFIESNTD